MNKLFNKTGDKNGDKNSDIKKMVFQKFLNRKNFDKKFIENTINLLEDLSVNKELFTGTKCKKISIYLTTYIFFVSFNIFINNMILFIR